MIIARILGWWSSAMSMCSVRHRPMPSAPSSRARLASSGASAFARTPRRRISSAHSSTRSKCSLTSGSTSGTSSSVTQPLRAVDRDQVALADLVAAGADLLRLQVDRQLVGADHRRAAHPARHQRRVRGLAALAGEDALRRVEARDVVGLGERAHEDHVAPVLGRLRRRPPP